VIATDGHPFWVPEANKWLDASELKVGMLLATARSAHVQISSIKKWTASENVLNLAVAGLHTFYVAAGTQSILVHNCDPPWLDDIGERHIRDRHFAGGRNNDGKSTFDNNRDLDDLVDDSERFTPRRQDNGRCVRVCDADDFVGVDQNGLPTKRYSVVQEENGRVVTAYPGEP
jgi:hypothetical protein